MCTSAVRLQQTNTNPINNTINMRTHINTITVTVDIDNLLKSVYAESAWLKASNMINGTDSPLLNPDRRAMAMMLLGEAYADLVACLNAYMCSNNADTFATDGMLEMQIKYASRQSDNPVIGLSTMVTQTLASRILALAYPALPNYADRYKRHRLALLTTLARAEQA